MSIQITNISKTFGPFTALKNVSLTIRNGELVALLGPSGCGKTTLLRIIAGLEQADPGSGPVLFHDDDVSAQSVRQRRVGFVFQHYSLFRHMNIFENVAFGLTVRPRKYRPSKDEIRDRVHALLKLVQLERHAGMYPHQLSGGQRQRVALARSLAVEPKILLLDEPFGALDAKVRKELRQWLRKLHDEMSITSVFVTHDQEEALEVADRIAVLNAGRIEQIGAPEEVYDNPANPFVFNFLGNVNIFHCRAGEGRHQFGGHEAKAFSSAAAYVRPHDIDITRNSAADAIAARVVHIAPVGPIARVQLVRQDTQEIVEAEITRQHYNELMLHAGESVFIQLKNARFFADDYSI
ncbi:MAG TPA: sulfate ABC transporter ATP-binding protein [Anaerohalosphaeraceae bacterium]|nr:sulfate ABC transporter ATP-binding protein [Anaerohalosphaeraceae bacterium]